MSLSEILVPNAYNLFANSLTVNEGVVAERFSAYLPNIQTLSKVAATIINATGDLVNSPNYNFTTATYTVPEDSVYQFTASIGIDFGLTTTANLRLGVSIIKNGSTVLRTANWEATPVVNDFCHINLIINLLQDFVAGDTVQLVANTPVLGSGGVFATLYQAQPADTYWQAVRQ